MTLGKCPISIGNTYSNGGIFHCHVSFLGIYNQQFQETTIILMVGLTSRGVVSCFRLQQNLYPAAFFLTQQ